MKVFLITLTSFLLVSYAFGQDCASGLKIESPIISKPTNPGILSTTCSTLVVQWQGSAGETYLISGNATNPADNTTAVLPPATNITCDNAFTCTATFSVTPGTLVNWNVQAVSEIDGRTFYSYPLRGDSDYPIPYCTIPPVTFLNNLQIVQDASCPTGTDGAISIIPLSGAAPFHYSISGGATYVSGPDGGYTFNNLSAGTYQLRLKDANGFESEVVTREVRKIYNCGLAATMTRPLLKEASTGELQVYPNPNGGTFRLQLPRGTGKAQVLVLDSKGQVVRQRTVDARERQNIDIDLRGKAKGQYLIKVVGESGVKVSKVIVQ